MQDRSQIAEGFSADQTVPVQPRSGVTQRAVLQFKYAFLIFKRNLRCADRVFPERRFSDAELFQIALTAGINRIGRCKLNRFLQALHPVPHFKIAHGVAQEIVRLLFSRRIILAPEILVFRLGQFVKQIGTPHPLRIFLLKQMELPDQFGCRGLSVRMRKNRLPAAAQLSKTADCPE